MRDDKENLIVTLTFQFALDIIKFAEELESARKYVIANQVLKSGTSIGANVREAQNAESKSDFIHKLKIAAKETDETEYFLLLCKFSESYPFDETLLEKIKVISRVLSKIISSSKSN
jgi:four helix bundle protein